MYKHLLEKYDNLSSFIYFPLILSFYTLLHYYYPNTLHTPSWLDSFNEPILIIYIASLLSIFIWLRISKILTPLIINNKSLLYIANNTYSIMLHHFISFMFIKYLFGLYSNINIYAFKHNIWYYNFPISENSTTWIYIYITLVITLLIGFTTKKICDTIAHIHRGKLL